MFSAGISGVLRRRNVAPFWRKEGKQDVSSYAIRLKKDTMPFLFCEFIKASENLIYNRDVIILLIEMSFVCCCYSVIVCLVVVTFDIFILFA